MRSFLSSARDTVRAELWPIPTAALVLAVLAGSALPSLDRRIDDHLPGWLSAVIFNGDSGSAQTVLDAISSSLITVTSLTFSLTVVTLQLASSQFSPRLLRTFSRDLFVQATLALFLATFVFSLAVLRLVRSEAGLAGTFVPRISVTIAYLFAVASVFMLVLFLAHLTRTIRVESMLHNVHGEAFSTMCSTLDERDSDHAPPALPAVPSDDALVEVVRSQGSGFLTRVDQLSLVRAAAACDAVVSIDVHPGDFVVRGVPVARAWPRSGARLTSQECAAVTKEVGDAVHTGFERTAGQDVAFGLRQLTDVANKALSPGINDPTTAVHAIGHLAALLCDLADRELGERAFCDDEGVVRVVLAGPDFAELVEVAITQPRRYGAADPQVLAELLRLLDALAHRVPTTLYPVVHDHLSRLQKTIEAQDFDDTEVAFLAVLRQEVLDHLSGRAPQLSSIQES